MFKLDNTEGYTQQQLDIHNKNFEEYFLSCNDGVGFDECEDEQLKKHLEEKYFELYMCYVDTENKMNFECIMQRHSGYIVKKIIIKAKDYDECFELLKEHPRYIVNENKFHWYAHSEDYQKHFEEFLENHDK